MTVDTSPIEPCRICGSTQVKPLRSSRIQGDLTSRDMAITDYNYGVTGDLHRCEACGFIQCSSVPDVLPLYRDLVDEAYEDGRAERALQASELLKRVSSRSGPGRLLDIGAGSGILVEEANALGYDAQGIEPSVWLQKQATQRGLDVLEGVLPHPDIEGPYDAVTLVDVIEHVSDPLGLLAQAHSLLAEKGLFLVVTPDVSSLVARILQRRWWHFRIAHIGYFNRATLRKALAQAGFSVLEMRCPNWFFRADYLWARLMQYVPRPLRMRAPKGLSKVVVPLNLRDSVMAVCCKSEEGA